MCDIERKPSTNVKTYHLWKLMSIKVFQTGWLSEGNTANEKQHVLFEELLEITVGLF